MSRSHSQHAHWLIKMVTPCPLLNQTYLDPIVFVDDHEMTQTHVAEEDVGSFKRERLGHLVG